MPFESAGDVRRRNGAEQIRGDDRGDERHRGHFAHRCRHPALRRITMRSGLPVKPQNERKPLWR